MIVYPNAAPNPIITNPIPTRDEVFRIPFCSCEKKKYDNVHKTPTNTIIDQAIPYAPAFHALKLVCVSIVPCICLMMFAFTMAGMLALA